MRIWVFLATSLWSLCPSSSALADSIPFEIRNRSGETIYTLTTFPSDLIPNMRNLISPPLVSGSDRNIAIRNDYYRCLFDMTVDFNPPPSPRQRARRPSKPFRVIRDFNVCSVRSIDIR